MSFLLDCVSRVTTNTCPAIGNNVGSSGSTALRASPKPDSKIFIFELAVDRRGVLYAVKQVAKFKESMEHVVGKNAPPFISPAVDLLRASMTVRVLSLVSCSQCERSFFL
jgi:hypothetical protein